jgi:hypothetical protein
MMRIISFAMLAFLAGLVLQPVSAALGAQSPVQDL